MSNYYIQCDFCFEEDSVLSADCEECGEVSHKVDITDVDECPECGGDLLIETLHECEICHICNHVFDIGDDAYRNKKDSSIIICLDCHENLPEG